MIESAWPMRRRLLPREARGEAPHSTKLNRRSASLAEIERSSSGASQLRRAKDRPGAPSISAAHFPEKALGVSGVSVFYAGFAITNGAASTRNPSTPMQPVGTTRANSSRHPPGWRCSGPAGNGGTCGSNSLGDIVKRPDAAFLAGKRVSLSGATGGGLSDQT